MRSWALALLLSQAGMATPMPPATPLSVGQVAPFDGMLLPGIAVLGLAQRASLCEARTQAEVQRMSALLALQTQQTSDVKAALSQSEAEALRCDAALQKAQGKVQVDGRRVRPWVWIGVGSVLGAGLAIGFLAPRLQSLR